MTFWMSDRDLKAPEYLCILLTVSTLPIQRMHWSDDSDLKHPYIWDAMSRSGYLKIKSYLHLQDNQNEA